MGLSFMDSSVWMPLLLGFGVFGLLASWRKLSARWMNWFPLLMKATKFALYGAAIGLVLLAFNLKDLSNQTLILIAVGAGGWPALDRLARVIRPKEKIRRGARVGTVGQVNKMVAAAESAKNLKGAVSIGGVAVPRNSEPYHMLVVGSTGTGKSVAISRLLDELEARGDVALIVDSGGDFCARYFKEGRDHILNPFDDRCVTWSPTAELEGPWDAEALAKSIIPDGASGDSKEWNGYAQTLLTSIMRKLHASNELSIKKMMYYAQAASIDELKVFLAGTPAAAPLDSDRTFGSIRTIATSYLSTYAYLEDSDKPFSISHFIKKEQPGFLFLTYRDDQLDSLRNMISCALDVAARTILSLPQNESRRVWLIIDEFASIGKVQSIEAVATKARKKGGCLLLGMQSISQLKDRYGEQGAVTILGCLSSWLVLRCSDVDTSEYISRYIGEAEISRMTRSESSSDTGGTDSLNEQINTHRAVMPSQLQRLPNLQGFFKLAGDYPICDIKLDFPRKRAQAADPYVSRDFYAKPMLDMTPVVATPSNEQPQAVAKVAENPAAPARRPRQVGELDDETQQWIDRASAVSSGRSLASTLNDLSS